VHQLQSAATAAVMVATARVAAGYPSFNCIRQVGRAPCTRLGLQSWRCRWL